ncbi:MAG: tripartite tricarboxylate transporter substrate binding protein [Xanthobacteraceae bacterium]|nr:tripartite tricarboxylate transporter substrate binding protein [Xanthobacteraceae bacterium]
MKYRRFALGALSCLALGAVARGSWLSSSWAQDKFPVKPVKIVVPYGPGGATDIVTRIVAEQMRQSLGQSFVVENKPGAFGIVAIQEMMNAKPDGYTLMTGNVSTNAITPVLVPERLKINYARDVAPVTNLIDIPAFIVVTTTNFAVKDIPELIAHAKKNPGKTRYGTVGAGSYPHFDMAFFAKRAGDLNMVPIHNKQGAAGIINDMLTGDVQVAFLNVASTAAQIKAGKLRPIAVVSPTRLPDYPDVPTMKEVGFPDVGTIAWNGMFAPAATPRPVLETLHRSAVAALTSDAAKAALTKQGFIIAPSKSLDDARQWLASEIDAWKKITAAVKIETE